MPGISKIRFQRQKRKRQRHNGEKPKVAVKYGVFGAEQQANYKSGKQEIKPGRRETNEKNQSVSAK